MAQLANQSDAVRAVSTPFNFFGDNSHLKLLELFALILLGKRKVLGVFRIMVQFALSLDGRMRYVFLAGQLPVDVGHGRTTVGRMVERCRYLSMLDGYICQKAGGRATGIPHLTDLPAASQRYEPLLVGAKDPEIVGRCR